MRWGTARILQIATASCRCFSAAQDILAQLEEAVTANDFELASKLLHDSALDPHRFSGQWDGGDALPPDWSLLAIMHRTVAAGDAAAVERLLQLVRQREDTFGRRPPAR